PRRDRSMICVVEEPKDVVAIERTREYRGLYHVLGGAIDPMAGVGPDNLRIKELMTSPFCRREVKEAVIATDPHLEGEATATYLEIATDPNLEGEATATYLVRLLGSLGVTVTRLASGLPVGGDLEYADEVTLGRAFSGRREID